MGDLYTLLWGILPMVISGVGIVVLVVVIGQVIKARVSAISARSFEKLATELKEGNTKTLEELTAMKESLSSINKMMKEIE